MKNPKITIRLNQDVTNIRCVNKELEQFLEFAQGSVFICDCCISELTDNNRYVTSNEQWEEIYFPAEVCDQLSVRITKQY